MVGFRKPRQLSHFTNLNFYLEFKIILNLKLCKGYLNFHTDKAM